MDLSKRVNQTIQLSISTQFQCQSTVPFQIIQFSISTQFSSIWLIDKTLSDATTPDLSGPWSDGNEEYSGFPKAPASLKPHHQIV